MVLAIITIVTSSLVIIVCIIQTIQSRRQPTSLIIGTNQQNTPLLHSLSTTNTSVHS